MASIVASIQEGGVTVVSDGSYFEEYGIGAAGWTIETSNQSGQCHVATPKPGPPAIQSSYQSELVEILIAVCQINRICRLHQIPSGNVKLFCNGEGAVNITNETFTITHNSHKMMT